MDRTKSFPRTDVHHCYICNSEIKTYRVEGDWERRQEAGIEEARKAGHRAADLDLKPLVCEREECKESYKNLPKTIYYKYRPLLRAAVCLWDGGTLFQFPYRNACPELETDSLVISREHRGANAHTLEPLFQEWLFFGLLSTILGPDFQREDYVEENTYLITDILDEKLFNWLLSNPTQSACSRGRDAVFLVQKMLGNGRIGGAFDEELMAFIAQTAETCWVAIEVGITESRRPSFGYFTPKWQEKRLVEIGWCPFEAQCAVAKKVTISEQSAFSCMERKQSCHRGCTAEKCSQIQKGLQHHPDCGGCEMVRIDETHMQQICSMIENGTYPLLIITDDGHFKITEHQMDIEYCAISHVWTQGMGNEDDNALHSCQLKHLYKLVDVPIWIDTICCPVERRVGKALKNKALSMMRKIYQESTRVLVIDTELTDLEPLSMSPLELASRVFLSKWASRLWTFQEGALPENLWIQFKDHALDYYTLWLALRGGNRSLQFRDRQFCTMTLAACATMRAVGGHMKPDTRQSLVGFFLSQLGTRSVSYARDEAVCIATLLALDIEKVLEHDDHESRMKVIWQIFSTLGFISKNIVYYKCRTLKDVGWSWAYSSFLQDYAIFCCAFDGPESLATATPQGLLFRAGGIALELGKAVPNMEVAFSIRKFNALYVKLGDQWWMFAISDEEPGSLWPALVPDMAILPRYALDSVEMASDGACVLVQTKGSGVCRRIWHGNMRKLGSAENANMVLAHAHSEYLRTHEDFLRLESMAPDGRSVQYKKCGEHLPFNNSLLEREDIPQAIRDIGPSVLFDSCTLYMLAGDYVVASETFSEQQEWCFE